MRAPRIGPLARSQSIGGPAWQNWPRVRPTTSAAGRTSTRDAPAASIRATDILFKEENRLPSLIPPHSSPAYRSVAYDLYTSAIVGTARFRSGVLTNPFSSVIGIVGEYGIGGTLVVGFMLLALTRAGYRRWKDATLDPVLRAAGATVGFAVPFIVMVSVFDSYFEQPDVMATIAVLAVLTLAAPPAHGAPAGGG